MRLEGIRAVATLVVMSAVPGSASAVGAAQSSEPAALPQPAADESPAPAALPKPATRESPAPGDRDDSRAAVEDSPGPAALPRPAGESLGPAERRRAAAGEPSAATVLAPYIPLRVRGVKLSVIGVMASGQTYHSLIAIGFGARLGRGATFAEIGAALLMPGLPPLGGGSTHDTLSYGGITTEAGLGVAMPGRSVSPSFAVGIMPRILIYTGDYSQSAIGLKVGGYVQGGIMFELGARSHGYLEARLATILGGFDQMRREGGPSPETDEWLSTGGTVTPIELGFQFGIGF